MTETVATRVEELLTQTSATSAENETEDNLVSCRLSLQMITWPHLGKMKEVCKHTHNSTVLYSSQLHISSFSGLSADTREMPSGYRGLLSDHVS